MIKQNNKSEETSKFLDKDKLSLIVGGIVVLIIAITPFIFYSYKSFPEGNIWETSFFTLSTGFPSWINFAYFAIGKIVPLILLFVWFFTCKHWWHWIILVPIAMYAFQLWGIINQSKNLDEVELYLLFPLIMILVPAVYLIRAKLFNQITGNDLVAFEEELGANKTLLQQLKDLFR